MQSKTKFYSLGQNLKKLISYEQEAGLLTQITT